MVIECCFFFFQAEDGIRDRNVTGVQTCALPICLSEAETDPIIKKPVAFAPKKGRDRKSLKGSIGSVARASHRSEERRVGKECRSRVGRCHEKKKKYEEGDEDRCVSKRCKESVRW